MKNTSFQKVWKVFFLSLYVFFILFPFYWTFLMSIKNQTDVISYPPKFIFEPTVQNYIWTLGLKIQREVTSGIRGQPLSPEFVRAFFNSLVICGGTLALSISVGTLAAYALAKFKFPARENIAFTFLSFRFAPPLAIIIPLYFVYQHVKLYDTYLGLILGYQLITLPLTIWLMRVAFEEIPGEIDEAATIDGCGWWQKFSKIDLPLSRSGLISVIVLSFIFSWNEFTFPLIIGGRTTKPVPIAMLDFVTYSQVLWGPMAAAILLAIIPNIVSISFILRFLVKGLTFGAIKE